ncbi:DUF2198 family protein [Bacillus alkalicellulosilyticus]|uniref:DUF2198 family protein n=1 Tax=Alkalihalobacterium alkalicellulosilyticum TaxID=1912214 RepID=UPI0009964112|nr:DUF2198 family protein [Bacillus alkalicellulosilyticus]
MLDLILALILPFIIMVVVTRVAFSVIGAVIVSVMIMIFGIGVHEQSFLVIALALVSTVAGWFAAQKVLKKKPGM